MTEYRLPLQPGQIGLRDAHLRDPTRAGSTLVQVQHITGPLDLAALTAAIEQMADEFETLRVTLEVESDGTWWQKINQRLDQITVVDLRHEPDPDAAALALAWQIRLRPVDLLADPTLFRVHIIRAGDQSVWVLFTGHHIICDGYTAMLVRGRIVELYEAIVEGIELPPSQVPSLAELVEEAPAPPPDLDFWRHYLAGADKVLGRRPVAPYADPHTILVRSVEPGLRAGLEKVFGDRVWPHAVIAAAASLVARATEVDDAVVGIVLTGRRSPVELRTPSQLMTTLPLRLRDTGVQRAELVRLVRQELRSLNQHHRDRPEQLLLELPTAWRSGRLFGPSINIIPFEVDPRYPGCRTEMLTLARGPIDDLTIVVAPGGEDGLLVEIVANPLIRTEAETQDSHRRLVAELYDWAAISP